MQNAQGTISSAILFLKFQAHKKVFCIKIHWSKGRNVKMSQSKFREQFSEKFDMNSDKTYPRLTFSSINQFQ